MMPLIRQKKLFLQRNQPQISYFHRMKGPLLFTILLNLAITTFAQVQVDSVTQKLDGAASRVQIDSVRENLQHLPDSLLPAYHRVDSIHNNFTLTADSLQSQYRNNVAKIDEQTNRLNSSIDSLSQLKLPTGQYTKRFDSLQQLRQNTLAKFTSKLDTLKARTTKKLNALDLPPEYKEPLQKLTQNVDNLNLNSDVTKIPSLKIPGYTMPQINGIPKVEGIPNLSSQVGDISKAGNINGIPEIKTPGGDIGNITGQAKSYQDDIKNVTTGNFDDVEKLPETLESQAGKIDGIDELQKQSGVVDEHKAQLDKLADPKAAKEKAVEAGKKAAVDHFAGKQEQLKAAMDKISKYKQKYSSVSSIKDLPKRPPNPMKGKPFVERLIPGLSLQYQQKNFYLLDVNPYVGYKLTGRFTVGAGWNKRFAWDSKQRTWNQRSGIFGPRAYVDFKLGKGFIAHLEGEAMNSFVPSTLHGNPDSGHREWVWSCMTGIKKEYKIYKNLKGTALIQYNLFNRYYKAPYVDRLNSRIGFEYTLKKKKKSRSD